MLKALKFVQGAVSKKDTVPALTHFAIQNGVVRGFNGVIGLCSPIPVDINCKPKATTLVKAIQECKEIPQLSMTEGGKLRVKSGKFRVLIDCINEVTPFVVPSGKSYHIDSKLLMKAVKTLVPVVTTNTKHAWANGIRFEAGSAFATNNVILIQYWTNSVFDKALTIPLVCLEELLRIGEEPTHVQISDTTITFHYEGGRWLYSALIPDKWPDISAIIDKPCSPEPVPKELYTALMTLKPFTDKGGEHNDRVIFHNGKITTTLDDCVGSEYEIEGFKGVGAYQAGMFLLLENMIQTIDLTAYPKPCLFFGENLRGAIVGMSM